LMVRRGSTVRVRQRACKIPAQAGFFIQNNLLLTQRAVGMEPLMELLRRHSQSAASPDVRSLASPEVERR